MMTRGVLGSGVAPGAFARALLPYLAAQILVLCLTLSFPRLVHLLEPANSQSRGQLTPLMQDDIEDRLRQMLPAPIPPGLPPLGAPTFPAPPSGK
jgi:hypothetical protein